MTPNKRHHNPQKGTILIIVMSVMIMLAVMGVTLVRLSTYEHVAVSNYASQLDASFAAWAGIERTYAEILDDLRSTGAVDWDDLSYPAGSDPDLVVAVDPNNGEDISLHAGQLFSLTHSPHPGYSYSGLVGPRDSSNKVIGRYDTEGNFYSLKIHDLTGRLNVNSHISAYPAHSNRIMNQLLTSLAINCKLDKAIAQAKIADKIRPSDSNPAPEYRNLEEMEKNIELAVKNKAEYQEFLSNLCAESWIDPSTSGAMKLSPLRSPHNYYQEQRAPIDVNQVSEKLLQALVENVRATAIFYYITATYGTDKVGGGTSFSTETALKVEPHFFSIDFSAAKAANIAAHILDNIKVTPYDNPSELEIRIDSIPEVNLPSNPDSKNIESTLWYQACRDALKSNFNPNVIDNQWNPSTARYFRVCKGDLYDSSDPKKGYLPSHTTELCVGSTGTMIVTSLGTVTANSGANVVGRSLITARIQFAERANQTTQQHFRAKGADFHGSTVSYPVVFRKNVKAGDVPAPDIFAGGIEPLVDNSNKDTPLYDPDFYDADVFPSDYPSTDKGFVSMDVPKEIRSHIPSNLTHDGIVSRRVQYADDLTTQYLAVDAISNGADLRTVSPSPGSKNGNVGNFEGGIEFWFKLADGPIGSTKRAGLPFGLFCAITHSNARHPFKTELGTAAERVTLDPFYEGTAIYGYINTRGVLRVSRMYYAMYWDDNISLGAGKVAKWRGPIFAADGDSRREVPRRDATVNVGPDGLVWKVGEWHHLRVTWDDEKKANNNETLELFLDDDDLVKGKVESSDNGVVGEFCVLNEINPRDAFFLNGFFRDQAKKGGYFHFSDGRIPYCGNATIDNVNTYHKRNKGKMLSRYKASPEYSNSLTLPGESSENYILGRLHWMSYPPTTDKKHAYAVCSTSHHPIPKKGDPSSAGQAITPGYAVLQGGAKIDYDVEFNLPSINPCPSLESVTLEVYYMYPKITDIEYQ